MHLYLSSLMLCTGCALTLAALVWNRRKVKGAIPLLLLLICIGIASFSYAQNLVATALDAKVFWNHAEYLGAAFLPGLMLIAAMVFTGRGEVLRPRTLCGVFLIPVVGLVANWTNGWHHLYYRSVWIEATACGPLLSKSRGPLYAVTLLYGYVSVLTSLALIVHSLRRASPVVRPPLRILLLAFLLPILLNGPYLLQLMPCRQLNLTLFGFFLSSILLSVGLFRYKLLAAIPLDLEERNELLLTHAEAIIYTIQPDGVLTYVSANWPRLLGHPAPAVVGRHFRTFIHPGDFPACTEFLQRVVQSGHTQTGIEYRVIHLDGRIFWHTSSIRPVTDARGRVIAYVGAAHDITRLKVAQADLHAANASLKDFIAGREEEWRRASAQALTAAESEATRIGERIHDTLCQDLIALTRAVANIPPASQGQQSQLAAASTAASQLAQQARELAHDLAPQDLDSINALAVLTALAARLESLFQVAVEVNGERWPASLPNGHTSHIFRIAREACGNAIKHGQARHIWIDVVHDETSFILSVTNDGRPLPHAQPTPGLGLRQIAMRTRLMRGTFTLRATQGFTTAQLIVPAPKENTR